MSLTYWAGSKAPTAGELATLAGTKVGDATANELKVMLDLLQSCQVGSDEMAVVIKSYLPPIVASQVTAGDSPLVTGGKVSIEVTFPANVAVVGTPQIAVTIGNNTRQARYSAGTGTTKLTFEYTIICGDSATAGHVLIAGLIALNGGTIKDPAGNAVSLPIVPPSTAVVTVN
jgi:hypothetical protein